MFFVNCMFFFIFMLSCFLLFFVCFIWLFYICWRMEWFCWVWDNGLVVNIGGLRKFIDGLVMVGEWWEDYWVGVVLGFEFERWVWVVNGGREWWMKWRRCSRCCWSNGELWEGWWWWCVGYLNCLSLLLKVD